MSLTTQHYSISAVKIEDAQGGSARRKPVGKFPDAVNDDPRLTLAARALILVALAHGGGEGKSFTLMSGHVHRVVGMNKRTFLAAVKLLIELGYLVRVVGDYTARDDWRFSSAPESDRKGYWLPTKDAMPHGWPIAAIHAYIASFAPGYVLYPIRVRGALGLSERTARERLAHMAELGLVHRRSDGAVSAYPLPKKSAHSGKTGEKCTTPPAKNAPRPGEKCTERVTLQSNQGESNQKTRYSTEISARFADETRALDALIDALEDVSDSLPPEETPFTEGDAQDAERLHISAEEPVGKAKRQTKPADWDTNARTQFISIMDMDGEDGDRVRDFVEFGEDYRERVSRAYWNPDIAMAIRAANHGHIRRGVDQPESHEEARMLVAGVMAAVGCLVEDAFAVFFGAIALRTKERGDPWLNSLRQVAVRLAWELYEGADIEQGGAVTRWCEEGRDLCDFLGMAA